MYPYSVSKSVEKFLGVSDHVRGMDEESAECCCHIVFSVKPTPTLHETTPIQSCIQLLCFAKREKKPLFKQFEFAFISISIK